MRKKLHLKTLLTASLVTVLAAGSSLAAVVDVGFRWNHTGPGSSDGSGVAFVMLDGIRFTGPMPTPTVNQKDSLLAGETFLSTGPNGEGVVGFANQVLIDQPGTPNGWHIGWVDQTVELTGSRDGIDYTFPVELKFEDDDDYNFTANVFDNPGGSDVTNGVQRFAGWVGDDGDGHRHSAQGNQDYLFGQDTFQISAGGNLGNNGNGDNVGLTLSLRNGGPPDGSVFIGNVSFGGTLKEDDAGVTPPIQPALPPPPREPVFPADPFSIVLDAGPANQRVQAGHISWPDADDPFTPAANTNNRALTDIPFDTGTGTTILASVSTVDWRDRGNSANDTENLVLLGEDFVKRNQGIVEVTLVDLPPGEYAATSYHMDPDNTQSEEILTLIDNNRGDGPILQSGAVGNANVDVGGVDNLTEAPVMGTSASFSFKADGVNPVTIIFDGTAAADTEVPFNGMTLQYTPGGIPGDVNLDDAVDLIDLDKIRENLFETDVNGSPVTLADGDANQDGVVNHQDYRLWTSYSMVGAVPLFNPVPEPASLGMGLLGAVALLGLRRRFVSTSH